MRYILCLLCLSLWCADTRADDATDLLKAKAKAKASIELAACKPAVKHAGCDCGHNSGPECLECIDTARLKWWGVKDRPATYKYLYENDELRGRWTGTKFQAWDGTKWGIERDLPARLPPIPQETAPLPIIRPVGYGPGVMPVNPYQFSADCPTCNNPAVRRR